MLLLILVRRGVIDEKSLASFGCAAVGAVIINFFAGCSNCKVKNKHAQYRIFLDRDPREGGRAQRERMSNAKVCVYFRRRRGVVRCAQTFNWLIHSPLAKLNETRDIG
jgi:hypothetical protein